MGSVIVFVDVVLIRVIGATVFISRTDSSIFGLFSSFFQQTILISILSVFFGRTLVCVYRRWCLWHVGSQGLSVANQGLPNHFALLLFLGVLQSVQMCQSPSGPGLLIFHVWWPFGIKELFNNGMFSCSE